MAGLERPSGMRGFVVVWVGQLVSQLGSAMGWFAFSLWAWQATGRATTLALVQFFAFVPTLLLSPLAGVLVDRWNRKLVMALADLGTALATLAVLGLFLSHSLQVWHLYLAAIFAGVFLAFQFPAYSAATILMLPRDQYARAESMLGLTQAIPAIAAPLLAAALMGRYGFGGVMLIDLLTFLAAFAALLIIHIPKPVPTGHSARLDLWQESLTGFRYIFSRPALRALVGLFFAGNFFEGLANPLIASMVLARSFDSASVLGRVQSIGAFGAIVGGGLITLLGGMKRRMTGILVGWFGLMTLGFILMGLGSGWITWSAAFFFYSFFVVLINSHEQALWQSKVDPSVLGRVSANRLLLIQVPYLVSMPLSGFLADRVFEPALRAGSPAFLADVFGSGVGIGMSLLILLAGLLGLLAVSTFFLFRTVRRMEEALPDFDGHPPLPVEAAA